MHTTPLIWLAAGVLGAALGAAAAAPEEENAYLRYVHPPVTAPSPDLLDLAVPAELEDRRTAEMGLVDVTRGPFRADPTGRRDSTAAIQAAIDFARDVVCEPAYAIADSVSSGFLVADAAANPGLYRSLVLVCPPEMEARGGASVGGRAMNALLRAPVVGTAVYNAIVSKPSIQAELSKVYERRDACDSDTVRYYHRSSHQPGAKWAAASFIGGYLKRNIRGEFRSLQMPVLLVWGDEAAHTPVENAAAYLKANPRAAVRIFEECGSLPHEEYPEAFNEMIRCRFAECEPVD